MAKNTHKFNGVYAGASLSRVAFPLGGIGAGMICIEGSGALSHVSLRHKPEVFNEPRMFAALYVKGAKTARVLEGPVPKWKAFGGRGSGNGSAGGCAAGLPRFSSCTFEARFPFANIRLTEASMPVTVELTGWSPFVPGDADASSLPAAAIDYTFRNPTAAPVEGVFSFHAANFMAVARDARAAIRPMTGGFVLAQEADPADPAAEGSFAAFVDEAEAQSDCAWFRGGWYDPLTMLWKHVQAGEAPSRPPHADGKPGGGASLYVPFVLPAGGCRTIRLHLVWHVPRSAVSYACACNTACGSTVATYTPWYATPFADLAAVAAYWRSASGSLRAASQTFSDAFYDTTLPPEAIEAVAANLTILKSPTCLRQADGRFWGWEGCCDANGCCAGSCTHVWNYAQAMPHLFPTLERSLRETEFGESQDDRGHQNFRTTLPIGPNTHTNHAAADGQLGGIMKVYREWRIGGDDAWMKRLWPRVRQSLMYGIETWDPDHQGLLIEPHHNTYDIEFWGADGMCTSFYLGALAAAIKMGQACGDETHLFEELLTKGRRRMEKDLWNGDYFIQQTQWQGLHAPDPSAFKPRCLNDTGYTPEGLEILHTEGPKYQYGTGCLSDGVLGDWLARCCGIDTTLSARKVKRHLASVYTHNLKRDLSDHSNPQRPSYAIGDEGGLLLCTWPQGGKPSLPFVYSDEVWTGIEYQVASHLILMGRVDAGLRVVRTARSRYDGRVRNPFNEYECGHWYARAMSSYALLHALSGARYDAVEKTLYLAPAVKGDFKAFLCTATGYGTVGVRAGQPFLTVRSGNIDVERIVFSGSHGAIGRVIPQGT